MQIEPRRDAAMRDQPAFDLWVRATLMTRYGNAAREPVPEDLLAILHGQGSPN